MKFVKVGMKRNMIQIKDDTGKDIWYDTTKAVKDYASSTFKTGDDIEIISETKPGATLGFVSRITKPGAQTQTSIPKFNCEICGKPLKDDKYPKCYECNQKRPTPITEEKNELIKREAVAHATSRAIIALQGQVDPNTICLYIETIYKKFLDLVEGK